MRLVASIMFAFVVAAAAQAHAKSAVQFAPDEETILVNKQVGTQQWVLSLRPFDEIATGNVFDVSGGNPTFFSCDVVFNPDEFADFSELASETVNFENCKIATGCAALPCDVATEWHDLGVTPSPLPGSFFLP